MKIWTIYFTDAREPLVVYESPSTSAEKRDPNEGDPYVSTNDREGIQITYPKWVIGESARTVIIPWHRISRIEINGYRYS